MSNCLALYPFRDSSIGLARVLTNMQFHLLALNLRVLDTSGHMTNCLALYPSRDSSIGLARVLTIYSSVC